MKILFSFLLLTMVSCFAVRRHAAEVMTVSSVVKVETSYGVWSDCTFYGYKGKYLMPTDTLKKGDVIKMLGVRRH